MTSKAIPRRTAAAGISRSDAERLKALTIGAASLAVLLPGWTFMGGYAPPLFEAQSLATGPAALVFLILGLRSRRSRVGRAARSLVGSLLLIISYGMALQLTTVQVPDYPGARIQVGFHLLPWSLTPEGLRYCTENDVKTSADLVGAFSFDQNEVARAWHLWSIYAANFLLIASFTCGALLWAYGFGAFAAALRS